MRNIVYILAALFSFGAAFYYYQEVDEKTEAVAKLRIKTEEGLVIGQGTVIDEAFMRDFIVTQMIPATLADEFIWAIPDTPTDRQNLLNQTFTRDVSGGSFLDRNQVFDAPEGNFSLRIKPGNRAFPVRVSSATAVENFILPGSRVDVLGTYEIDQENSVTRPILQNVEVMAVGEFSSAAEYRRAEQPNFTTVTLQAPSEDVLKFLAEIELTTGDPVLTLLNPCEDPSACVGDSRRPVSQ